MASPSHHQSVLDTVVMLADQIARAAPECADAAMQIVKLVQELAPSPDRDLIKDAIEAETVGTELSDATLQTTTDAVVRAVRAET